MIGIQVNGEFLDLPPGTTLELESENPFLQFDEILKGEYSLPFQVSINNKNNILLDHPGVPHKKLTNTGIDAILYDKAIQLGSGKIKIEKARNNLNRHTDGIINCYYLSKISSFYKDIENIKMRDVTYADDVSIAGNAGIDINAQPFGAHVKTVMQADPGSYDYAFFPVQNAEWGDDPGENVASDVMNKVTWQSGAMFLYPSPIVPFPYLKFTLQKIFEHIGWQLQGDILDDEDFQKIVLLNLKSIKWGYKKWIGIDELIVCYPTIEFNIKDHMPDMLISEFLIALKNRFGWWYDVNNSAKTITIKSLKLLVEDTRKDFTEKSSPIIVKNAKTQTEIYALRNDFALGGNGGINTDTVDYQGAVDSIDDLPAAAEGLAYQVYLVEEENNYYVCEQNPSEVWEWLYLAANIYDLEPADFTKEIFTKATTVENMYYDDYLDFIPRLDGPGLWTGIYGDNTWGIHLCFFHGMADNKGAEEYPLGSHHIYDSTGNQVGNWSLAFKGQKTDGTQVGLYDLNWILFLAMISESEEVEHTLYLPLHEYLQLKFSDRVVVNAIELFIKQIKATVPYMGQVDCVSIRV